METLKLLQTEYVSNAAKVGSFMKAGLQQLLKTHSVVGDVRGLGLMLGVDIVKDKESRATNPQLRDAIAVECFKRGLLVLGAGPSTIRLSPPLLIDEEQAECATRILSESISAVTA
jgi:4-aminobutyrate aminotransferase